MPSSLPCLDFRGEGLMDDDDPSFSIIIYRQRVRKKNKNEGVVGSWLVVWLCGVVPQPPPHAESRFAHISVSEGNCSGGARSSARSPTVDHAHCGAA